MNILYLTTDIELAKNKAKAFAIENELEWHEFHATREDMNSILSLYENDDDCMIFLEGLTKSNISNALLKVLEETQKNIYMYATSSTYDVNIALQSRFYVEYLDIIDNKDAKGFIQTRKATKDQYSNISFYIDLAKLVLANKINMYHNIPLISDIIEDIKLTTTNTLWDYQYSRLANNFKWVNRCLDEL